ncbi:MAG TPA: N-acetylmuramoyl-L-alanine amidase-like domain-containing protein [Usitatibacteraceae bacterium]|nr:N-acetylmuramoyl-L-alanine amidase-like domain-containing protein [Usitatibacteraceae bacterium]
MLAIGMLGLAMLAVPAGAQTGKPLYKMQPAEVHAFLAGLQKTEPDLRKRVGAIARKNIGQPYEIFLLGEFPFELADHQPLFDLTKSDCLVFAEHTYAMAMAASWEEFFWLLQRIRYKDGVIGVATRNHYQEADWNRANDWLVKDVTRELAGSRAAAYTMQVDRRAFLKKQFKVEREIAVETVTETYVPKALVLELLPQLKEGDFVNVVSSKGSETLVTHVGLIVLGPGGERRLIHSAEPMVREESFAEFIARAAAREAGTPKGREPLRLLGFKFLRLNERPDVPPMKPQPRPGRP